MAYIGREPAHGAFEKQSLTADGSTTTFTLNFTVGSSSALMVSVAGVYQEPEVAYNLSDGGTKIVFTAAPESGDTCFIVFLGIAFDTGELLSSGTITNKTAETSVADDDLILISDTSAGGALRKMTKANFAPAVSLTYTTRNYTGDGSDTTFTVTNGTTVDSVLVTENGVLQKPTTDYTISGTTLTFQGGAPADGVAIQIRELPVSSS
tara:strand:- start:158 stop:781 length:624 start_codon:yes stop_codon:yes gene_type:complete